MRGDKVDKAYSVYLEKRREHLRTGLEVKKAYKEYVKLRKRKKR